MERDHSYQALRCSVDGAQTQIGSEHFPDDLWFKPDVGLCTANLDVPTRFLEFQRFELVVVSLQHFLAETGADLADRLEFFGVAVITGQQECAVHVCSLAFAVVAAYDDEIERIADPGKIIFLELQK